MQSSPHPLLTAGSTAHRQQGSAKPMRIKEATTLRKAPMSTLCEYKLRKALGMEATDPTENLDWYNAEMEDCATGYASFIMELLEDAKGTRAEEHF